MSLYRLKNHPMKYPQHLSFGLANHGVLAMVFNGAGDVRRFLRSKFQFARGQCVKEDRKPLRYMLGSYFLLGLEFLIAADIIDTPMTSGVQDLIVLGAIVLIRTDISYSLNAELKPERQPKPATP